MATAAQLLEELEASVSDMDLVLPIFKACLYGPKGVGKTVILQALAQRITPADKQILYVDSGGEGWVSLLNHPGATNRTRLMDYKGISQLNLMCDALEAGAGSFADIGCVVLDEFSTMAMMDQDTVLVAHVREALSKGKTKDEDTPEWDEFNANTQRMRRVMYRLLKMSKGTKCHVLIAAHMRSDKEKGADLEVKRPDFMPKLSKTIGENVHIVGHVTADQETNSDQLVYKRLIQVNPSRLVDAKSRVGGFGLKVTPSELTEGVVGWLKGNRSTISKEEVAAVPVVDDVKPIKSSELSEDESFTGVEIV